MRRNVVVIGASAGGLEALRALVARLPADLAASLLVVTHLSPTAPSRPAEVVNKIDAIPVGSAVDGQPLLPGRIVTAVPDRHLLIGEGDLLRLSRGPRENRSSVCGEYEWPAWHAHDSFGWFAAVRSEGRRSGATGSGIA